MTKKTILKWLEKLFVDEIEQGMSSRLPMQLPKKTAVQLIELGYVEEIVIKEGFMQFICHKLTLPGHYFYCSSCKSFI